MKSIISAAIFALTVMFFSGIALAEDVPAKRLSGSTPTYPAACRSALDDENTVHIVSITYDVSRTGFPENVRVRESTDDCFNDVAIAAIRGARFEPRRVDGNETSQEDMETTFIFKFEEETESQDFDARPLVREPPEYPEKCTIRAANRESVVVKFDVSETGATENIRVVESTNGCLNNAAIEAVESWVYEPKQIDGEPVARPNVETLILFLLDGPSYAPQDQIRPAVHRAMRRVQRQLKAGETEEAFAELNRIEEKYGADFTTAEMTAYYQLRGAARLEAGDYSGALDDFRTVLRDGSPAKETRDALIETVEKLEVILALQEQEAAQEGASPPEQKDTEEPSVGDD